jgi:hypothetical protein
VVEARPEAPPAAASVCDPGAVARALQAALGPQRCAVDADCNAHGLSALASMLPTDARARLGAVEADPMHEAPSVLVGPDTTLESLVDATVELVGVCAERRWAPGRATATDGNLLLGTPVAESAVLPDADGVARERCVVERAAPACAATVCTWRPDTRTVPCSEVSARSSM